MWYVQIIIYISISCHKLFRKWYWVVQVECHFFFCRLVLVCILAKDVTEYPWAIIYFFNEMILLIWWFQVARFIVKTVIFAWWHFHQRFLLNGDWWTPTLFSYFRNKFVVGNHRNWSVQTDSRKYTLKLYQFNSA